MLTLVGLFAEIERHLISERTRAGLEAARGRVGGRPKGVLGQYRLDGRKEETRLLLNKSLKLWTLSDIIQTSIYLRVHHQSGL